MTFLLSQDREISYGTTKIQKKITYGSQFICQSQNLHLIWKIWLSGYWDVGCIENTFDHQKWWLFSVFCGVQPAQWDRRINFVQKIQKVVLHKMTYWSFWTKSTILSHCAGCTPQKTLHSHHFWWSKVFPIQPRSWYPEGQIFQIRCKF